MANIVLKTFQTKDGRVYGLYVGICGRDSVVIATTRGLLYRFNYPYMCDGRFYSTTFSLRQRVGGIDVYASKFQREESVGLQFKSLPFLRGHYRFSGSIHYSRTGLCSMQFDALNGEIYPKRDKERERSGSEAHESEAQDVWL